MRLKATSRSESMALPLAFLALATVVAFALPDGEQKSSDDARTSSKSAGGGGEAGHGRDAATPAEIPARGWKDVLLRTGEQIGEDRLLAVAAGVVFYGLLALFPAITALVSSYALFADPQTINEHLSFIAGVLPSGTFSIVQDQVGRVLAKGDTKLGFAFGVSLLLALWSANGGMKAIIDALNVVYDEDEKRGFVKLNAVSLAFTLGGLCAILASIGLVIAAPIVLSTIGLGPVADAALEYGRWPALALMVMLGLAVLYRFAPSRKTPKWAWGFGRQRAGHGHLDSRVRRAVLLSGTLCRVRRDLRLARRSDRADDVDVDVHHCCAVRRRTELRAGAPDSQGQHRWFG
jgi:uncharacterized BrkB/YihY/UPF0761 family membrane protein